MALTEAFNDQNQDRQVTSSRVAGVTFANLAESLETTTHNFYVQSKMEGSDDPSRAGIRINLSGRIGDWEDASEAKKSDRFFRDVVLRQIIADLQEQIAGWQAEIKDIDQELTENNDKLSAIDQLKDLLQKGELDPNNPAHAELLRKAGIDPNTEPGELGAKITGREQWLRDRQRWLVERKKELEDKIQNKIVLITDMESGRAFETSADGKRFLDPTIETARQRANIDISDGMSEAESHEIRKELVRSAKQTKTELNEVNSQVEREPQPLTADEYEKLFVETFDIQDPEKRLEAQYDLFVRLSEDEKDALLYYSENADVQSSLDDDYFSELRPVTAETRNETEQRLPAAPSTTI